MHQHYSKYAHTFIFPPPTYRFHFERVCFHFPPLPRHTNKSVKRLKTRVIAGNRSNGHTAHVTKLHQGVERGGRFRAGYLARRKKLTSKIA